MPVASGAGLTAWQREQEFSKRIAKVLGVLYVFISICKLKICKFVN